MPRKPREFVAGGIYHVFNRGNNRRVLFEEERDFKSFMGLLASGQEREEIKIFHYCLMSNPFHMLVQSEGELSLPRFMHWVQLAYARYFKSTYKTTGHVFEERYRSPRIAEESYYVQCGRYIERNPVKAKMVERAEDYSYSSARYYVTGKRDYLLTENLYYSGMGHDVAARQQNYATFLRHEEPYAELITDQLLKY